MIKYRYRVYITGDVFSDIFKIPGILHKPSNVNKTLVSARKYNVTGICCLPVVGYFEIMVDQWWIMMYRGYYSMLRLRRQETEAKFQNNSRRLGPGTL